MRSLVNTGVWAAQARMRESTKENDSSAERVSTETETVIELASATSTDSPNLRVRFSEPHRMTVRALKESTLKFVKYAASGIDAMPTGRICRVIEREREFGVLQ